MGTLRWSHLNMGYVYGLEMGVALDLKCISHTTMVHPIIVGYLSELDIHNQLCANTWTCSWGRLCASWFDPPCSKCSPSTWDNIFQGPFNLCDACLVNMHQIELDWFEDEATPNYSHWWHTLVISCVLKHNILLICTKGKITITIISRLSTHSFKYTYRLSVHIFWPKSGFIL